MVTSPSSQLDQNSGFLFGGPIVFPVDQAAFQDKNRNPFFVRLDSMPNVHKTYLFLHLSLIWLIAKILRLNRCSHDSSPSSFRFKSYLLTTYHKGRHWAGVFLNVAGSSGICLGLRNTWWWELEHCRASLAICHLCFSLIIILFFSIDTSASGLVGWKQDLQQLWRVMLQP